MAAVEAGIISSSGYGTYAWTCFPKRREQNYWERKRCLTAFAVNQGIMASPWQNFKSILIEAILASLQNHTIAKSHNLLTGCSRRNWKMQRLYSQDPPKRHAFVLCQGKVVVQKMDHRFQIPDRSIIFALIAQDFTPVSVRCRIIPTCKLKLPSGPTIVRVFKITWFPPVVYFTSSRSASSDGFPAVTLQTFRD